MKRFIKLVAIIILVAAIGFLMAGCDQPCSTCGGSGNCKVCSGTGGNNRDCTFCKGTGVCPSCHGSGKEGTSGSNIGDYF